MNVLWLCNLPVNAISRHMGLSATFGGGWLESLYDRISERSNVQLHYCFFSNQISTATEGKLGTTYYYALPRSWQTSGSVAENGFVQMLNRIEPDIIHIFGSEYRSTLSMVLACESLGLLNKVLVHIQGLVSVYAQHYDAGIPVKWKNLLMPRDFIKNSSIRHGKHEYIERGKYEVRALRKLQHVCGRTDWDKACTQAVNSEAIYYHCNETLRASFYAHNWRLESCEKYSIFVSQGNYPIKGLHFLLEALSIVVDSIPSVRVYIAGIDPVHSEGGLKGQLRRTSYGQYIQRQIVKRRLNGVLKFLGPLSEKEMLNWYLRCHLFVSPSTIENSPNSLGEAMLLGMPCISSSVGGVPSMLKDKEEGFLYQFDAPYMLAFYILKLFEDDDLAKVLSNNAKKRAQDTHNIDTNVDRVLQIYGEINREV